MKKTTKRKIKKTMFYIRRELIRWAVMLGGTLAALCILVSMLENPDSRTVIYVFAGWMVALMIGNQFYGKKRVNR
ncbi:MAG: hypothetical protein IKZ01_01275 [Anaerotignum sp.]|nr:hypothetical protein [Anaerotignum sp.]MBR5121933.1 hypothetical protein [Anaerotignum sp.]